MHKRLEVWKLSMELVTDVYRETERFPTYQKFSLVQQLQRAAVSIPSNIAEEAARQTNKEFVQFLHVALGSCAKVETQLLIARNLGYPVCEEILMKNERIKRMLSGLIKKRKDGQ